MAEPKGVIVGDSGGFEGLRVCMVVHSNTRAMPGTCFKFVR